MSTFEVREPRGWPEPLLAGRLLLRLAAQRHHGAVQRHHPSSMGAHRSSRGRKSPGRPHLAAPPAPPGPSTRRQQSQPRPRPIPTVSGSLSAGPCGGRTTRSTCTGSCRSCRSCPPRTTPGTAGSALPSLTAGGDRVHGSRVDDDRFIVIAAAHDRRGRHRDSQEPPSQFHFVPFALQTCQTHDCLVYYHELYSSTKDPCHSLTTTGNSPESRYPLPRTVSTRAPAAPNFVRNRFTCVSGVRVDTPSL
jgi:hypothetical protein